MCRVNSFKIDDDGVVTDFENENDDENDFNFNFIPELSDTVLHQSPRFSSLIVVV